MREITTQDFRANLAENLRTVRDGQPIIVRRYTEPAVVVISIEQYEALKARH